MHLKVGKTLCYKQLKTPYLCDVASTLNAQSIPYACCKLLKDCTADVKVGEMLFRYQDGEAVICVGPDRWYGGGIGFEDVVQNFNKDHKVHGRKCHA
jgi:hypothetical protein